MAPTLPRLGPHNLHSREIFQPLPCYSENNMEPELDHRDIARPNTTIHDKARHSFTIYEATELFAELGVPRSKRSVQRFCEQGHLDCVRIKGSRGDKFFINRESVERYAEELRQIDAVASIGAEPRHDTQQHDVTRNSAPERATGPETAGRPTPATEPEGDQSATIIQRLRDENLNLRIDNRGKEQAINFLTTQMREKDQSLQNLSYRLGVAETHVAQLEAPRIRDDAPRQSATDDATEAVDAIMLPDLPSSPEPEPGPVKPPRSIFGRFIR
jgi:hypothetical protein